MKLKDRISKELPSPLYKNTLDSDAAQTMFEKIVEYMELPNNPESAPEKDACIREIIELHQPPKIPTEELVFQLLKQTRKNPQPFWARNVWKLFGTLLDSMEQISLIKVQFCVFIKTMEK